MKNFTQPIAATPGACARTTQHNTTQHNTTPFFSILRFAIGFLIFGNLNAQIKVATGGLVYLSVPFNNSKFVSIGEQWAIRGAKFSSFGFHAPAIGYKHNGPTGGNDVASYGEVWNRTTKNYVVSLFGVSHNFYVEGDGKAFSVKGYLKGSDSTLKFDVNPLTNAMEKINQLSAVTYRLKPSAYGFAYPDSTELDSFMDEKQVLGFIAQQIEPILPEVVDSFYVDSIKGWKKAIDYAAINVLLTKGLQEQQTQIEQLATKLSNDSALIAELYANMSNCLMTISTLQNRLDQCCPINGNGEGNNSESGHNTTGAGSGIMDENENILYQNIPNPFKFDTRIGFHLAPKVQSASLIVFDMQGKLIVQLHIKDRGKGFVTISKGQLPAGMYLYSLMADGKEVATRRMILTAE